MAKHYTELLSVYPDSTPFYRARWPRLTIFVRRLLAWLVSALNTRKFICLEEEYLQKSRKSDTVFVFGSGFSLRSITSGEWEMFEKHDTFGFNWFIYQNFIRVDYHLVREAVAPVRHPSTLRRIIDHYCQTIAENPRYENTILLIQEGWSAVAGNWIVARLKKSKRRIFRWMNRSRSIYEPPSGSFADGIVHGPASLVDCINIARLLGWKTIVLVGVDLYDRRYFWLGENQTDAGDVQRGASNTDPHSTSDAVVPYLKKWKDFLEPSGIRLFVYNPRSLLAEVLPVYPTDLRRTA